MNQQVRVTPGQDTRGGRARLKIPIIVVPGIMGTRLVEHGSNNSPLVWNPCGSGVRAPSPADPRARTVNRRAMSNIGNTNIIPDEGWQRYGNTAQDVAMLRPAGVFLNGYRPGVDNISQFNPNQSHFTMYNLVTFYRGLVRSLANLNLSAIGYETKVLCCGYDWRQSNVASASGRLSDAVETAKREFHAEKVIIVAHSMGGLVARHYCHSNPDNVQALFLLASPSLGAPKAYSWLKWGELDSQMRGLLFGASASVFGGSGRDYPRRARYLVRRFPAVYELMPTDLYTPHSWLTFTAADTGYESGVSSGAARRNSSRAFSDCSNAVRLYQDIYTGIADGAQAPNGTWAQAERDRLVFGGYVVRAATGHAVISVVDNGTRKPYMHPRTYLVYADRQATIDAVRLANGTPVVNGHGTWFLDSSRDTPTVTSTTHNTGDSTVPSGSGNPPMPTGTLRGATTATQSHELLPSESTVVAWIGRQIRAEMTPAGSSP